MIKGGFGSSHGVGVVGKLLARIWITLQMTLRRTSEHHPVAIDRWKR